MARRLMPNGLTMDSNLTGSARTSTPTAASGPRSPTPTAWGVSSVGAPRGQGDVSQAWLDLCAGMIQDLRKDVDALKRLQSRQSEELAAVVDCLVDAGVLSGCRFQMQMHRRRFAAAVRKHGLPLHACLEDVLVTKEIILGVGLHGGSPALRQLSATSRATSSAALSVLRTVRELYPGDIYVCGGSRDGVQGGLNTVECFDPLVGAWKLLPPMAERREFSSACVAGGKLYVCGGRAGSQPLSSVECFEPVRGKWEPVPNMLSARAGASSAVCGGRIYVCGGWRGTAFFRSTECFDPEAQRWQKSPEMNEMRGDPAAATVGGRLYVCGGYDGSKQLNSVEAFDPISNMWEVAPQMNERRMGLAAAGIAGRLYVCGGSSGTQALSSGERFLPEARCWEPLPPMRAGRFCASAASTGGRLFVFGGMFIGRCLSSCEQYDPSTRTWTALPHMNERRTGATVAAGFR